MQRNMEDIVIAQKILSVSVGILWMCINCAATAAGVTTPDDKHMQFRTLANQLFDSGKITEALPIYEQLVKDRPDDPFLLERFGFSLASTSVAVDDIDQRRAQRLKAREQLLRAKELGDNSDLIRVVLEGLGNGSEKSFSENQAIDKLMRSAEDAFTRGNMEAARVGYLLALQAEPALYEAALYMGDTSFRDKKLDDAGFWFQKAIQIDPNRETAYRYWGDALMAADKMQEAREQFINAIIAEPYTQASRTGLSKWMQRNKLEFNVPQIVPAATVKIGDDMKTTIIVNTRSKSGSNEEEMGAWLIYAGTRSVWVSEKFAKLFPDEKKYRHSLMEEVTAYRTAIEFSRESAAKKPSKKKEVSQLDTLTTLINADLLDSYILLFQPDEGIAQDYSAYREQHRENLRRMLDYVAPNSLASH